MCVKVTSCTPWWHLGLSLHKYSSCFNRSMLFPTCVIVTACAPCVALKLDYIYIHELYFELVVSMKLWCLLEPSSAQGDSVGLSRLGKEDFEECCYSPTMD